ncbi:MAG: MraY family glycosyltransferase [Patescibacteria group bacterium]
MENSNFPLFFGVIAASLALSAVLVPLVRFLALRWQIVDRPEAAARKVHIFPTPLLGGWVIFLSVFIMIGIIRYFNLADFSAIPLKLFLGVILAAVIIIIGGTLDDKYNLQPYEQIIFPLAAVIVVLSSGLNIGFVTNPFGGLGEVIYISHWLGLALTAAWLLGLMYTTKFLDGLDGLVSGIAAIASLFIFLASLRWDIPLSATGVWSLVLLGAALGFLIFNWQPAKIFLGEGGSILIGFLLAILSIITGSKITTTLLVLGIPALDVIWVIIQRLRAGQSPFSGDRSHLHYRLMALGLSKKQVVWLLYLVALIFGLLGFISSSFDKMILVVCLVALMAVISGLLKFKK